MSCSSIARLFVLLVVAIPAAHLLAEDLDRDKLRQQLIRHEGKRNKVYLDSVGVPTIGVGFNLKRADAKAKITAVGANFQRILDGKDTLSDKQILTLLDGDIDTALADCKALFPDLSKLNDVRQRVLVDMTFNLGKTRLAGFKKMNAAVKAGDFTKAADEMKDSTWYKQVKTRGVRLKGMMRTGKDPAN